MTEPGPAGGTTGPPKVDWDEWAEALRGFGGATGLSVSAFDDAGRRRFGPYVVSRLPTFLLERGAWADGGALDAIEQQLVRQVLQTQAPVDHVVERALSVVAVPLPATVDGPPRAAGVILFGWALTAFTSSLECQRMGTRLGVDGGRLWAVARLESPVSPARLSQARQLMATLVQSTARHASAMARVEALARLREVFLASVSHELRTPLNAILLRTSLLLRGGLDDPDATRAQLEHIRRHVSEQARLVEDLIDAARTRTGQLVVQRRPTALAAVLQAAVDAVRPTAQQKDLALEAHDLARVADVQVLADPHRLQQVFWNLLSNAIKFTPPGGVVQLTAHVDDDRCQVQVTDTGSGIDPVRLQRVFEPFEKSREGNAQGLGLGLAIARQIVQLHDGTIHVHSDGLGRGTRMQVTLPRHGQDDAPAAPG